VNSPIEEFSATNLLAAAPPESPIRDDVPVLLVMGAESFGTF
jgi:hypothetical protein